MYFKLTFNKIIKLPQEYSNYTCHELCPHDVNIYNTGISSFPKSEKKEEIWLSPMTNAPTPTEMSKGQSDNTNNATKKFD